MCVETLASSMTRPRQGREAPKEAHSTPRASQSLSVLATEQHSPGINEVLGKADVGWGPCDGDLAF